MLAQAVPVLRCQPVTVSASPGVYGIMAQGAASGAGMRMSYTSTQDVVSSCTARGKIAMKHLLRSDTGHIGGEGLNSGMENTDKGKGGLNSSTEEPATQGEGLGSGTGNVDEEPPHEIVEWTVVDE